MSYPKFRDKFRATDKQHRQHKEDRQEMEAYCVKCKAKREMKDPTETTMKNGKPATTGKCSVCGTKMFKIGGSSSGGAGTSTK